MGGIQFCHKKIKVIPIKYNNEIAAKIYARLPTPIPGCQSHEIAELESIAELSQGSKESSNISSSSIQYNAIRQPSVQLKPFYLCSTIAHTKK